MSLKNIIGQDKVINFLIASINNDMFASSYLFIGPDGVGKTLVAKEFAKLLNCETASLDACDICNSCMKINKNIHPDVHVVEKDGSDIKIDNIRQLERDIHLKPFEARKKVFIVKDAHFMNAEAANALLKTLEEPPKDSIIILTTSYPHRIFSTIASRCRKVYFSSIDIEKLSSILENDFHLGKADSHYLSYFTEGRLGKAVALKEKEILGEKNMIIDDFINSENLRQNFFDLDAKNKDDIRYNLDILMTWFRDIMLLKCGIDTASLVNSDRRKELLDLKNEYKMEDLLKIMHRILDTYTMLDYNINPKFSLEFLRTKTWEKHR
ncbi:MAG: DNA polymerase III subunit delta' [Candidatus Omnitrophica bacterium]|nr:DNA polymerase III subunit delta' [Candidatus Omnitrophota bacterium]